MPTGTGKSGVIAVAAHRFVSTGDVLLLTPWDALADQLARDVHERFWNRIEAKRPTEKAVVRVYPSKARAVLDEHPEPAIFTATTAALQQLRTEYPGLYAELKERTSLVVVDEGHYEPAASWAVTVRALDRPTVLFTATPYRNDFKFFEVDPDFCFLYSHDQAEDDRFLRGVRFEHKKFGGDPKTFATRLVAFHRKRFGSTSDTRVIVRCATKNSVQSVTDELIAKGVSAIGIHERFEAGDGPTFVRRVPDPDRDTTTFWVHQNKLIEGIDNAAFRVVAFFEPFGNERAFVQQIGRVLRNPGQPARQRATVFCDPRHRLEESWNAYREYDRSATPELLLDSPRAFAEHHPPSQYVAGRFRERFDISSPDAYEDFDYPRSVRAFIASDRLSLDAIARAIEKEWKEYDLDVQPVLKPDRQMRVHAYIAIRNSPLLLRKAFTEYELGFTVYRRIRDYLFFHDTHGRTPEILASLHQIPPDTLQRLYPGTDARLTTVSLLNTNIGRYSSRRRTLQAYSIAELGPDLADHAHFASTAVGVTAAPAWDPYERLIRYVGFTKSRITDRAAGVTPLQAYVDWLEFLAKALDKQAIPLPVFDRYAEITHAPTNRTPVNILLDFEQELFQSRGRRPLLIDDLCMSITNGKFKCNASGKDYTVSIAWDKDTERYRLFSHEFDSTFSMKDSGGNRRASTLVAFLNQEQAFRVIPIANGGGYSIYSAGSFYRPRVPLWGKVQSNRFELLQILEPIATLAKISSEKGPPDSAGPDGWVADCLFGLIDKPSLDPEMERFFTGFDLVVCDDMGTEIADFVALNETTRRVVAIHAKAFPKAKPLSASALHDVSSQALKNLSYFQPYEVGTPSNLAHWNGLWRPGGPERIRLGGPISANNAWQKIRRVLLDPQSVREVWLVLGQGLSKSALDKARQKNNPPPETIQILYSLQSTWGAVASVGARFRVFCSP